VGFILAAASGLEHVGFLCIRLAALGGPDEFVRPYMALTVLQGWST